MREQIAGAQAALESDIELLRHAALAGGDGAGLAAAQDQMTRLSGLLRRVEHSSGASLSAMRAEVSAFVAASQTLAHQARSAAANAHVAEAALHAAQAEAHRATGEFLHDFYERKIFDPYLRFDSVEEERAYREREEARRQAIEAARAEGTPEGELRATRLALAQLDDAGAHGADRSADFEPMRDRLKTTEDRLAARLDPSRLSAHAEAAAKLEGPDAAISVPSELLASLRDTGIVMPDQSLTGQVTAIGATSTARGIV